jgi:uncharacterized membrane protein YozB (DUF420 family)
MLLQSITILLQAIIMLLQRLMKVFKRLMWLSQPLMLLFLLLYNSSTHSSTWHWQPLILDWHHHSRL